MIIVLIPKKCNLICVDTASKALLLTVTYPFRGPRKTSVFCGVHYVWLFAKILFPCLNANMRSKLLLYGINSALVKRKRGLECGYNLISQ